jgi:hypothetical protein
MSRNGISVGGPARLRQAIEVEVRLAYEKELSSAMGFWQRRTIERKIRREVDIRFRRVASPFSLWSSSRFRA